MSKPLNPSAIARRDMNVALTLTRKPEQREPRRETKKSLAWMREHFGRPFIEARAAAERVRAEYEASKKALKA